MQAEVMLVEATLAEVTQAEVMPASDIMVILAAVVFITTEVSTTVCIILALALV
jgi:hypothetical protein